MEDKDAKTIKENIAKIIKELRLEFNYSQELIAKYLDISLYKYKQIEKADSEITIVKLTKLANLYGVNLDYFFDEYVKEEFKKMKVRWHNQKEE